MIDDKIVEDALSAEYRSSTNVDNLKFNGSKVRHFLVGALFKNPNQVPSLWLHIKFKCGNTTSVSAVVHQSSCMLVFHNT